MRNILEELYYGSISPHEGTFPRDPAYKPSCVKAAQLEELLLSGLPGEAEEIYGKLQMAHIERGGIENAQIFADAFKRGPGWCWKSCLMASGRVSC